MVELADAYEKLRWARHHLEILRPQIESFEQRDTHRISVDIDHDAGEYTFYVHDLELVDPDWGLIIGDCIHNARTALDYVIVRLWALATGVDPSAVKRVQFPIHNSRDEFKASASQFAKEPGFSGYLATIEQLQPFNRDNLSIWGKALSGPLPYALGRLSSLDNIDKHRVPHVAWAGFDLFDAPRIDEVAPADFTLRGSRWSLDPLENDAEIGYVVFQTPLPSPWEPSQVDMERCFPLQVAFGQPGVLQGVVIQLWLSLWGSKRCSRSSIPSSQVVSHPFRSRPYTPHHRRRSRVTTRRRFANAHTTTPLQTG